MNTLEFQYLYGAKGQRKGSTRCLDKGACCKPDHQNLIPNPTTLWKEGTSSPKLFSDLYSYTLPTHANI